jgi:hypothetical protein
VYLNFYSIAPNNNKGLDDPKNTCKHFTILEVLSKYLSNIIIKYSNGMGEKD